MAKCTVAEIKRRRASGQPVKFIAQKCGISEEQVESALNSTTRGAAESAAFAGGGSTRGAPRSARRRRARRQEPEAKAYTAAEIREHRAAGESVASLEEQCGQDKVQQALETMVRRMAVEGHDMKAIVAATGLTTSQATKVLVPEVRRDAAEGKSFAEIVSKSGMTKAQVKKTLSAMIIDLQTMMEDDQVV